MGRHEKAHDPYCPVSTRGGRWYPTADDGSGCWVCDAIRQARADERARWSPPAPVTPGHVAALCWCPTCLTGHDVNVEVRG